MIHHSHCCNVLVLVRIAIKYVLYRTLVLCVCSVLSLANGTIKRLRGSGTFPSGHSVVQYRCCAVGWGVLCWLWKLITASSVWSTDLQVVIDCWRSIEIGQSALIDWPRFRSIWSLDVGREIHQANIVLVVVVDGLVGWFDPAPGYNLVISPLLLRTNS